MFFSINILSNCRILNSETAAAIGAAAGYEELNTYSALLQEGGRYEPSDCRPRNTVAIVIPFRNRESHLAIFLAYIHPFLQRQQLAYTIFVIEQSSVYADD